MSNNLTIGGPILPIIPKSLEDAYRLAEMTVKAGMAPASFKGNASAVCVAVVTGMEIGIPPMQAIQGISVINGRPTIWGDLAIAIVLASGVCEYIKEWTDGETAYCEGKRKDRNKPEIRKFSQEDARKAGLLDKPGPWQTYTERMRQMRARAWLLRDVFSDVLKGLRMREEEQDVIDITPTPPSPPSPSSSIEDQSMGEPDFDEPSYLANIEGMMQKAKTVEDLERIQSESDALDLGSSVNNRVQEMFDLYESRLGQDGPVRLQE